MAVLRDASAGIVAIFSGFSPYRDDAVSRKRRVSAGLVLAVRGVSQPNARVLQGFSQGFARDHPRFSTGFSGLFAKLLKSLNSPV
jgi:hypothetical protein